MHQRYEEDSHCEEMKVTHLHKTTNALRAGEFFRGPEVVLDYTLVAQSHLHVESEIGEPKGEAVEEKEEYDHS